MRGLFITSEMPPLIADTWMYDEDKTGIAYQKHKLRNVIPFLRRLVMILIQSSQVNVVNEAMPYEEIFNELNCEIDRLLPFSTNEKENKLAKAALLRIYEFKNTKTGYQFFEDFPYLLALIRYDGFGWREGFDSYDARMLNLLRSLIDSAEAYGEIDLNTDININAKMSCIAGIFEGIYFALQPQSEPLNFLFYVQATGRTCVEVYNMLARLLNEEEFKHTIARNTALSTNPEAMNITVIVENIIITIRRIEQERITALIDNYRQKSPLNATLIENIIYTTETYWQEIETKLVTHLKTNLNFICEAYNDNDQNYDQFHFREIIELAKNLPANIAPKVV